MFEIGDTVEARHGTGEVTKVQRDYMGRVSYLVKSASFEAWANESDLVRVADWASVQAKGRKLFEQNRVTVTAFGNGYAEGDVEGSSGTYHTRVEQMQLTDDRLQDWSCTCPWEDHRLHDRTTLTDQPCSHAVALMLAVGFDQIRANRQASLAWERDNDQTLYTSSPSGIYYRIRKNDNGLYDIETSRLNNGTIYNKHNLKNEADAIEWCERKGAIDPDPRAIEDEDIVYGDEDDELISGIAEDGNPMLLETNRKAARQLIAGKAYTYLEQQELIDEEGISEDSIARLDLTGTHYLLP